MRTRKWMQWLFFAVAAVALSGCAERYMVTSFQDITSESKRQGWFYGRQYSSISIPGFISAYEPGLLYSYNPARGPLTATGIAVNHESYIVSKTIPAVQSDDTAGLTVAGQVKLKLDAIKTQTLKVVRLRMEELKSRLNDTVPDDETKPFVVDDTITRTDYNDALEALETLEEDLAAMVSENGIMIFRWAYGSEKSAQAKVSEAASTSASSAEAGAGYAIINGLRVSTLYMGSDLLSQWNHADDIGFWRNWLQIVTQVAQAREIAYSTELNLEKTFQADLELSYDTAQKIAKNWKKELTLIMKMFSARFEQTANTGVLGKARITWQKVKWHTPPNGVSFVASPLPRHQQNWITFYQTSTSLKALKKALGSNQPSPPATRKHLNG